MRDLDVYASVLTGLPGVKSYQLLTEPGREARLKLDTASGARSLAVQLFRSHLSSKTAGHIVAAASGSREPVLILAPHVGAGLAATFAEAGVNYLDALGNCHIAAAPLFIHIEGKTGAARAAADKGMRSASYQVLFTYLAEPHLLDAPLRTVADVAGVSRQPVSDMRRRLVDDEYVLEGKTTARWHPRRLPDALSLWLRGYETTVRPSLLWGTYRTNDATPIDLEQRVARVCQETGVSEFRWGGSAAGFRLDGHYRGDRTVVHVHATGGDFMTRLQALADPRGNLVLMDAFGALNWNPDHETVHPLLVYSEMISEGSERAREAAHLVYDKHLAPTWARAR